MSDGEGLLEAFRFFPANALSVDYLIDAPY